MNKIDFRSDTVTWPTAAMRDAMATAPIGDDVYGEDETVNELEALAADMLGFEAGLFVTSGTQGNLLAILAHAGRGDEAIVGEANHTYQWEAGGMAVLGGIVPNVLPMDEIGRMSLDRIRAAIRPDNPHMPTSRLILVETTAGGRSGAALPLDYLADVRAIADEHGLIVHMDGARVFNAATTLGVDVKELTKHVSSVSVCLSKGLCAPVGSVVVGSAEFIHKARRLRKLVGGGMRQAGVIAAAGILSLREMTKRLHEDHANAQILAEKLAGIPGIAIDLNAVHSNLVFFTLDDDVAMDAGEVARRLQDEYNIWIGARSARAFRAVTHYWVGSAEIAQLSDALEAVLSGGVSAETVTNAASYYG